MPNYLDLFAGAGGLSEGFLQAGYTPVAHIEMDEAACYTLKTRVAAKWLKDNGQEAVYNDYLNEKYSRNEFYSHVPEEELSSVLQREISRESLPEIFSRIDERLGKRELDLIVGGPPCQAYSLAGRSRSKTKMRGDKRNYLYKLYAEFLKRYTPKFFVFENVTGLLSAKDEDGKPHFIHPHRFCRHFPRGVQRHDSDHHLRFRARTHDGDRRAALHRRAQTRHQQPLQCRDGDHRRDRGCARRIHRMDTRLPHQLLDLHSCDTGAV